jgi:hypothetical protein
LAIGKINQQPNSHPNKKPFPATKWDLHQKIKARQNAHDRNECEIFDCSKNGNE